MVNESSKKRILSILKENSDYISGDRISSEVSTSRVAVWKNINSLIDMGYPILTSKKGYYLENDYDLINSLEFTGKIPYHHSVITDSTMNFPWKQNGIGNEFMVTADSQSNGMGRFERKWQSAIGGLYFTLFIKKLNIPVQQINFLPLFAAQILVKSIKKIYSIKTAIKWPNDIYWGNKKVAGILINSSCQGTVITEIAAGIGININNRTSASQSTSLSKIKNTKLKRNLLLNEFYLSFMQDIYNYSSSSVSEFYRQHSYIKNSSIQAVDDQGNLISGTAGNLDRYGGLIVHNDNRPPDVLYSCRSLKIF